MGHKNVLSCQLSHEDSVIKHCPATDLSIYQFLNVNARMHAFYKDGFGKHKYILQMNFEAVFLLFVFVFVFLRYKSPNDET